jgi:hypothetical protein
MTTYVILCRYQYWGPEGIDWTKWYIYKNGIATKKDGEEYLNYVIEGSKKDKLKQEYQLLTTAELKKFGL